MEKHIVIPCSRLNQTGKEVRQMIRDEGAETRLEQLAEAIVAEAGLPTKASGIELYQAFIVFGPEEPQPREMDLGDILRDFGFLGWLFSLVFGRRVRRIFEQAAFYAERDAEWRREEWRSVWEEARLRERLLEAAVAAARRANWDSQDEGRKIRDRASRAASKARDETVKQLRQKLLLGRIRLLQKELEVAQQGQMKDQIVRLQEALAQAFREAEEEFETTEAIVEELAEFDALMASDKKLRAPKRRRK